MHTLYYQSVYKVLKIAIHPGTSKQSEETAQYAQFNLIMLYMLTVAFINPTHAAYNHMFSKSLVMLFEHLVGFCCCCWFGLFCFVFYLFALVLHFSN